MAKYKSDINLFDCIFKDKTKKAVNLEKEVKKSLLVFAGIAVVCAAVGGSAYMVQKIRLESENAKIKKLRAEHDFDAIASKKAESERLEADNKKIRQELSDFESSPQFKIELWGYIAAAQPQDIRITSIRYSDSVIKLECVGTDQLTGANFANRLREETKVFSDVKYTGASSKADNTWTFEVDVTIVDQAAIKAEEKAAEQSETGSEETTKEG